MKRRIGKVVVTFGMALVALAVCVTPANAQQQELCEGQEDTGRWTKVPVHIVPTQWPLFAYDGEEVMLQGHGSVRDTIPVRFQSGNLIAFEIGDGRRDGVEVDGRFLCALDYWTENEGCLKRVEIIADSLLTRCDGVYERMPTSADETIKCLVCPFTDRRVCGSNPQCMD